jgi:hypothetical protein
MQKSIGGVDMGNNKGIGVLAAVFLVSSLLSGVLVSASSPLIIETRPADLFDKTEVETAFQNYLDGKGLELTENSIYMAAYSPGKYENYLLEDIGRVKGQYPDFRGVMIFYGGPAGSVFYIERTDAVDEGFVRDVIADDSVKEKENDGDYKDAALLILEGVAGKLGTEKKAGLGWMLYGGIVILVLVVIALLLVAKRRGKGYYGYHQ